MGLRIVSPVIGKKVEDWAFNYMMATQTIAIQNVRKIKERPQLFQVFYNCGPKCNLGTPSINDKGQLCVDFENDKRKAAFLMKYSDRSVWWPDELK